jgi:hypothetical protein
MFTPTIAAAADSDRTFWFDSTLDNSMAGPTVNAELTINLTLKMNAIDPVTIPAAVVKFLPFLKGVNLNLATDEFDESKATHWMKIRKWNPPWNPSEFKCYMHRFEQGAERFWNGRFWLVPPATFTDFDLKVGGATYRPNIYCRFDMHVVDKGGFHVEADAYRLDLPLSQTQSPFRSYAASPDFHGKFSNLDVVQQAYPLIKDDKGHYHKYYQDTNVHETGHMIGMDHAATLFMPLNLTELKSYWAALTSKDGFNSRNGYGEGYRPEVGGNVMGFGHGRLPEDALPWRHRMAVHTKTDVSQWAATDKHIFPKKL